MIQSSTDVNKASFPSISKETPVVEQQAVVSTRDFNTPMVRLARRSNYIAREAEWYTKSQRCYTPSALTESLSRSLLMLGWSSLLVHTPRKSRLDVFQAGYYW